MKTNPIVPYLFEKNIAFPNILVKTRFGNIHLKSLIQNKRIIIYTNPSELIPKTKKEKERFKLALKQLKELNYHLIGFSKNSFEEHLFSINWLNSQLEDYLVFPIFYQPQNEAKKTLEEILSKKILIDSPIYFIDKAGNAQSILNGDVLKEKGLENIVEFASKMVLSNQSFNNPNLALKN